MKANHIERHPRRGLLVFSVLVALIILTLGVFFGYSAIRDLYLEQCVIHDMSEQVEITSGRMVKADVIAENLGLRKGANLALIDFAKKREEALAKIHTLRDIRISRRLPDRLIVVAEERTPVARMNVRGSQQITGNVVDAEGMVFVCQRGTRLLPTIHETKAAGTPPGNRLTGRARAALVLVNTCHEPEFAELNLLDVDVSRPDYLLATLGNYSSVKISWEGMDDEPNNRSQEDLVNRLRNLLQATRTIIGPATKIWNLTQPDTIFADAQEKR